MVFAYFILGLALLVGTMLLARWFVSADPKQVARIARWTLAGLGVAFGLYLLFAGRQALAVLAIPALIPVLLRFRGLWQRLRSAAGPSPGQTSEVSTAFLHMVLDHNSGAMDGEVLTGRFQGRRLGTMDLAELLDLWDECRDQDEQSQGLLEAYLDRVHGTDWRAAAEGAGNGPEGAAKGRSRASGRTGRMTRDEAYEILGLQPGADEEEVREAHRRLMQKIHPDHGGSNYLAAKINQAKDLLLGG